ncbi:hypothetical protein AB0H49_34055 [Nocardia sp. NPDC050713]|uniref:hypothetical protein n=1 Tax=Nocardia sp. NPDC050713 TaxID=3154511 RepID=UPI003401220F
MTLAHEDPHVREIMQRIGSGTSQAERAAAREELMDYINGPGRHLEIDVMGFARAHLATVDREAWNLEMPDAARSVPAEGPTAATDRSEQGIRQDFLRWIDLRAAVAHGENEIEREQLLERAAEIEHLWTIPQHSQEWNHLRQVHQLWQHDPSKAHELTQAALAHGVGTADGAREARHMVFLREAFDPQRQERLRWQQRHDEISDLQGELAASRTAEETAAIDARIAELYDKDTWPASWKEFEEEVHDDPAYWQEQSERASHRYNEVIAARETESTVPEPELELEESPW